MVIGMAAEGWSEVEEFESQIGSAAESEELRKIRSTFNGELDKSTVLPSEKARLDGWFDSLAPKAKNAIVVGGLTTFAFGVCFHIMRAVGGTDELQVAIEKFAEQKKQEAPASMVPKA